jgi:hypothetical protein
MNGISDPRVNPMPREGSLSDRQHQSSAAESELNENVQWVSHLGGL